ncbi:uncharacterized protein LOC119593926 [Penaeus monodon]|uniref:uncharacterized protein LOC119593924 n=1 Tax=Penaeus monodon TaxID=6687 RepID=UPI0018A6E9B6|nr:uncharacterized protein LOC119593924 [Penaeus monodon]XP_037798870.1 uncharacterized protein LOC119593925 [Penaeus monodon]XP_037798871.1 uncharacterized protein LOC119593926 [Penaeus monodon]
MVNGKLALAAAVLGALQLSLCLAAPGPWKAPVVHSVGVVPAVHSVGVVPAVHAVGVAPAVHAVGVVAAPVARPVGVAYVGDHDDDGFGDDDDVGHVVVSAHKVW